MGIEGHGGDLELRGTLLDTPLGLGAVPRLLAEAVLGSQQAQVPAQGDKTHQGQEQPASSQEGDLMPEDLLQTAIGKRRIGVGARATGR